MTIDTDLRRTLRAYRLTPHRATFDTIREELTNYDDDQLSAALARVATKIPVCADQPKPYYLARGVRPLPNTRPDYTEAELARYRANLSHGGFHR